MATKTANLELTKPSLDDNVDISVLNENFDIIDTAVAEKIDKVEGMGLSENSFTDAEKQKLSELENYDDSNLLAVIESLKSRITALESNGGESEDEI